VPTLRRFAAVRARLALPASLALALVAACGLAPQALATQAVIGFDHFPGGAEVSPGTVVTNQWESEGLRLGKAGAGEEVGDPAPGEGNCGPPHAEHETAATEAASKPNFALLSRCPVGAGPVMRGTYGALVRHPKGPLSVEVRSLPLGSTEVTVSLTAYNAEGVAIEAPATASAVKTGWTKLTVPNSANASISYLSIVAQTPNENEIAIDNLTFEAGESTTTTTTTTLVTTTPHPTESPSGGVAPVPPTAVLALATPNPHAGAPIALSAAGSAPGGGRIISYGWNFGGGEKVETSTGTNPEAHVMFAPGVHTVTLKVTNSEGESSMTHLSLSLTTSKIHPPDGGEGECLPKLEIGDATLIAECIQKQGSGYVIQGELAVNGMMLVPKGGGFLRIRRSFVGVELTGAQVYVQLENTPIAEHMVLGERNLEAEPIILEAFRPATLESFYHGARRPLAHSSGKVSKTLLMAFGVGKECSGAESKKAGCCPPKNGLTACATLPGNFPLTGQIDVYLTNKGQALFDVQVGLSLKEVNFEATGALEIISNLEKGIELESLKFEIGEASLAPIFKVKGASFEYFFPEYYEESKRDSWQAKGTLTFGEEIVELAAELAFKHGEFHSASMKFKVPHGGVPIYPGVLLNEIGAGVTVKPLGFEGSLGASIVEEFELELAFRFREATSEELGFFGGKGTLSLMGHEIASLAADVYTDGYMDAQLKFHIQVPFESSEPFAKVAGEIGFWDEPNTAKWEANGFVEGKIWILEAEIAGLVNNRYLAGCGRAGFGPFKVGAYGFYDFANGESGGQMFPNDCKETLEPYREHPAVKHTGGFVGSESVARPWRGSSPLSSPLSSTSSLVAGALAPAGGESETVDLPGDAHGEELRVSASSGTPIVTLVGPSGETLTTPSAPGERTYSASGSAFAALAPGLHQVIILLKNPRRGEWRIERDPGSGPIGKVEGAGVLPAPTIRVHVHHHGKSWALAYRVGNYSRGMKVELLERGRDSEHVLATVGKARGSIRFVPGEGLGRARRLIAAVVNDSGAPLQTVTVGHYTAPAPFRPGRPRGVRIARHGHTALVSWGAVPGARSYRIRVRGSDGRLETHFRKPGQRSVPVPDVLPFESLTATVTAVGGKDMLRGRSASARLRPVKARRPRRRGAHRRRRKHG
jgi:PKD repeat protein